MSSRVCFLCVQVIDTTIPSFDDKETRKIRISSLCELLFLSSNDTRRKGTPQFEEDATCEFCPVCAPVISEMEQIRYQMSLLEEQIGRKITKIREMMLESSSSLLENGDDGGRVKIRKLRTIILQITESDINTDDSVVLGLDEIQVKVEEDIGLVGNADDQFFDDYINSFSPTADMEGGKEEEEEEEEMDPFKNDGEDDFESAFCIIPHPQKRGRGRPRKSIRTNTPRLKPKRENSSPSKLKPKRIKEENIRPSMYETRCSPRIKKTTLPPANDVKTLKLSLKRISESLSIDDTKPEFVENDLLATTDVTVCHEIVDATTYFLFRYDPTISKIPNQIRDQMSKVSTDNFRVVDL
ncbi:uncharacterized protein LOC110857398 [Folsomia candida]|nr:uncharacterized protein LOC110857398 [Folsomia candida]